MEVNFKREIDSMKGRKIDIAFVPLDPRQEEAIIWEWTIL